MDDLDRQVQREIAAEERGTWREALRADFAPWCDDLFWGVQCADGWAELIRGLAATIAGIVGGPEAAPQLRLLQVKQKLGGLRVYLRHVPESHAAAVQAAVTEAEAQSFGICETCGRPGRLRQSHDGWWHTACDRHALD